MFILRLIGSANRRRLHRIARRYFGLQITTVPERRFDMWHYEMNITFTRRLFHFQQMLAELDDVEGRIVECGVGPGRSIFAFSMICQHLSRSRKIFGFDTFQGIPPPTAEDGDENSHKTGWWCHSLHNVVELLKYNGLAAEFIDDMVSFVPGRFDETLPRYDGEPIALLHLDIDFYQSYVDALDNLWPFVAVGGKVAFDEYKKPQFPGATKAVDEFFQGRSEKPVKSAYTNLYYVTKT